MAQRQSSAYARTRNRVRDRLRTENNKAREEREATARRVLMRSKVSEEALRKERTNNAVLYNTALLTHKVLGSFGLNVPVRVKGMSEPGVVPIKAWTDFHTIDLEVDLRILDIKDVESVAEFVYMVKGAVYHEGGHNMFTTPYRTLKIAACADTETTLATRWRELEENYGQGTLHRCWNILEDQRMERAVVDASPMLANYLVSIVYACILDTDELYRAFPYITQRTYLDKQIRHETRMAALASDKAHLVEDVERVVAKYCTTNNVYEQVKAFLDFVPLMIEWGMLPPSSETIHNYTASKAAKPKDVPGQNEESDKDTADDNSQPADGSDTDDNDNTPDNSEGDNSDQGNDGQGLAESEPKRTDISEHAPKSDRPSSGSDLTDLRDKLKKEQERLKQSALSEAKQFAARIHEDINSDLPRDPTGQMMPYDMVSEARNICNGVISSMEHLLDQTSPSWRFRQESGVLDPTSYTLREPGDTDYWSGLDGVGQQGYDLSVTVMLDTSYSMCTDEDKLSVAALAIRMACDEIGVPCTVTTWNTAYNMLYKSDEELNPVTISATGGTEPGPMLDQLDNFRYDKRRQLVFILTDGEWEGVNNLGPWASPGRYIVLVGLRVGWNTETYTNKNPDAFVQINRVADLPNQFRNALVGFLA